MVGGEEKKYFEEISWSSHLLMRVLETGVNAMLVLFT